MTFGQQLKALRKEKELSQDALALKLYVTRQSVSQWENDKSMPSVDLLLKLSQIFDVTVDRLLGKDEPEDSPILSTTIITEKKELRRATRFRFSATVTLLFSAAAAVLALMMFELSLFPAIYRGLPYNVKLNQVLGNYLVIGGAVIAAVVLLLLRRKFYKRTVKFAEGLSGQIVFYTDNLVLTDKEGIPTAFFYANLPKIFENDCTLSITLPNRQIIILSKADLAPILPVLAGNKNYKCKKLAFRSRQMLVFRQARTLQIMNNVLFVTTITAALSFEYIEVKLRTNGELPTSLRWILFLLPWVVAAAVTALGIWETVHKIRAIRLIIAGATALSFLTALFVVLCCLFTTFNFNMRALPPEEFLTVAAENKLTVTEANRDNPEDFLWECYNAKNADGTVEITYLHFQEEMRWTSVRSARGAYDRLHSRERAKTNNNVFGNQIDFYTNAYSTYRSENGHYYYISQNRYTVIVISTDEEHRAEAENIFADYKLELPY